MARIVSPNDIERYVDVSADQLRDMRRRGMLNNIGQQIDGRWIYDENDVATLVLSRLLLPAVKEIGPAIEIAQMLLPNVLRWWSDGDAEARQGRRYAIAWPTQGMIAAGFVIDGGERQISMAPARVDTVALATVQVDLKVLAEAVPTEARQLFAAPGEE